jgi:hypothetical protein
VVSFTLQPLYLWIRSWVDSRGGLDDVEKRRAFFFLPGLKLLFLGREFITIL